MKYRGYAVVKGACLFLLPPIGQPCGELANGGGGEVDQQLNEVMLWIDVMVAGGAGQLTLGWPEFFRRADCRRKGC